MSDPFDEIVAGLDLNEAEVEFDVTKMTDLEVNKRYQAVRQELLARGEMLDPRTDRGRELHSERTALVVALRQRRLIGG